MKNFTGTLIGLFAGSSVLFLAAVPVARGENAPTGSSDIRSQVQAHARAEIENQRSAAAQQATRTIDKDAVEAIRETSAAEKAAADGKTDEALAAIERATGKINILVARHPANALIPVEVQVEAIDAAPLDRGNIRALANAAEDAVKNKDYPAARTLLMGLVSELRLRTFNLPLASYPAVMKEAARLLDQKKDTEAASVLHTGLSTLVIIDHVRPLPLIVAQAAINEAQVVKDKNDRQQAQKLLALANAELDRAKELGYAGMDPEYNTLTSAVSELQKQVNGNENTESAFAKLKERIASFFHRHAENEKKSEVASQ